MATASWTLTVEYAVDTDGDAILADVAFEGSREYDVYALVDTTITNVGSNDRGDRVDDSDGYPPSRARKRRRRAQQRGSSSTTTATPSRSRSRLTATTVSSGRACSRRAATRRVHCSPTATGRGGDRDGHRQRRTRRTRGSGTEVSDAVALGFAENADTAAALGEARGAISRGFADISESYVETWREWLADRKFPASVTGDADLETQYRFALMTLAAVEDKRHDGAGIASPSVPYRARPSTPPKTEATATTSSGRATSIRCSPR